MMRFVFTKLFYALLAIGLIPLSLSWNRPMLRWLTLAYDLALISAAIFDAWNSRLPARVRIDRHFGGRFAVGAETEVRIEIANHTARDISLIVKDEYPPQMKLSGAREARDQTIAERIRGSGHDDRYRLVDAANGDHRLGAGRGEDVGLERDELADVIGEALLAAAGPAIKNHEVLAFDVTSFIEAFTEWSHIARGCISRPAKNESDHWHRGLLRASRERPSNCHAPENRDELAPLHASPLGDKRAL